MQLDRFSFVYVHVVVVECFAQLLMSSSIFLCVVDKRLYAMPAPNCLGTVYVYALDSHVHPCLDPIVATISCCYTMQWITRPHLIELFPTSAMCKTRGMLSVLACKHGLRSNLKGS